MGRVRMGSVALQNTAWHPDDTASRPNVVGCCDITVPFFVCALFSRALSPVGFSKDSQRFSRRPYCDGMLLLGAPSHKACTEVKDIANDTYRVHDIWAGIGVCRNSILSWDACAYVSARSSSSRTGVSSNTTSLDISIFLSDGVT
ncbi:hypothetical protein R1flu_022569 [Riccia fluitans]|uniref:Uncharacterized protein n=1 Tax=Riccia fluitans TaxID=41844 RepID=A0ABD1XPJ7_9MARC